ncbi:hypothetical protein ASPZODRAFT_139295 [Penicilliopsis zonata CBS 506.65]|uniref:DCG1-like protein n=1 Tax=Penicilliopsis zonata CBS 506.65 TaxID=1073090 RepID=A0A1L9SRW6_9EURO|nr:hypothetical protein ASPZODRAFT_139295 [Penicilliopsis zonata CBS 506.65]OJJ49950.1 hypothetical protein ASPZODRAFT_139295 [Penicilliopsis zonata CBS 506.65]
MDSQTGGRRGISILIINPNTSTHMTEALKPIIGALNYSDVEFDYFTAPANEAVPLPDGLVIDGVPSINSGEDSVKSALHCRPFVLPLVPKYDGFLVACYSAHPLVGILKEEIGNIEAECLSSSSSRRKFVTGIFEASISTSLVLISCFHLLDDQEFTKIQGAETFGIVTTGSVWKAELSKAVTDMLVRPASNPEEQGQTNRFAGVETTGLTAVELHETPPEEVKRRMVEATERLLQNTPSRVGAICLGCAGMAGMEEAVRAGCVRVYGREYGKSVRIVDGVVAGVGMLVSTCKAGF